MRLLGIGSYAVVKYGIDKQTKEPYAVKFYEKVKIMDPIRQKNYEEEVANLRELNHPNIIKLYEVIDGRKKIAMVMEYIGSNSLFEHIIEHPKGKLTELGNRCLLRGENHFLSNIQSDRVHAHEEYYS